MKRAEILEAARVCVCGERERDYGTPENNFETIGLPAVLEQCAEELAELTQAALKMARKLRGENPTPMTHAQAAEHLHEELGDVRLCLKVLDVAMGGDNTTAVEAEKLQRWLDRLTPEQEKPE